MPTSRKSSISVAGALGRANARCEEMRRDSLSASLSEMGVRGFVQQEDFPAWIAQAISECLSVSSEPHARVDAEIDAAELTRWIVDFSSRAGLVGGFYCKTGLRFFPWIDISRPRHDWPDVLRSTLGRDLFLVSHAKDLLVVIFEEEYEIVAFNFSRGSGG